MIGYNADSHSGLRSFLAVWRRRKKKPSNFTVSEDGRRYAARQALWIECERKADILLDQARLLDRPNGIVGRMKCISPLSPIGDPVV